MKTTAFLTLTGTGTVMKIWLTQVLTAGAAAPELLLLFIAVAGLGAQTLHSERAKHRPASVSDSSATTHAYAAEAISHIPTESLLRA
jgi:hypothetical protein